MLGGAVVSHPIVPYWGGFTGGLNYIDENDGWNQLYTTTGGNERVRDIAKTHGVDLDQLILRNKMDGQLLSGRSRLKRGTEIWLPDDPFDETPFPPIARTAASTSKTTMSAKRQRRPLPSLLEWS